MCISEKTSCVCQDQWDASYFHADCANQQGCGDCAGEGRTWCPSTELECVEVERNIDGTSLGWFWCTQEAVDPSTGISFECERYSILRYNIQTYFL